MRAGRRSEYERWIRWWRSRHPRAFGWCAYAASMMRRRFRELILVRGEASVPFGGILGLRYDKEALRQNRRRRIRIPHWWCRTAGGTVLDPTADAFAKVHKYAAREEFWWGQRS